MPPLTRQHTIQSMHSWWSDRNSQGATINLHAASKPLMRLLYHRAVLEFIQKNRDNSLCVEILEIYSSYLACKYVSPSTKTVILWEFYRRAFQSKDERALLDSVILNQVAELLKSPDRQIRRSMCRMVGGLYRTCTLFHANFCVQLVSLLRDENTGVVAEAILALGWAATMPEGAQATMDAKILEHVSELLESSSPVVRERTCLTVGNLANHEYAAAVVLALNPCMRLVSLLRDKHAGVVRAALFAFFHIAQWPKGAQAVVNVKTLKHLPGFYQSDAWYWTCQLLKNLTSHESMAAAVLSVDLSVRLVSFLPNQDVEVIRTLCNIAHWPDGAQAMVRAKVLDHAVELLESRTAEVRDSTCDLLRTLASHDSTTMTVWGADSWVRLVPLLRDTEPNILTSAVFALATISESTAGVTAIMHTRILEYASELMESVDRGVRFRTCVILRNLAHYSQKHSPCFRD